MSEFQVLSLARPRSMADPPIQISVTELNRQVTEGSADMRGITESYEHAYHFQSYFLIIPGCLFASPAFRKYWNRFHLHTDRDQVIRKEVHGLATRMQKAVALIDRQGRLIDVARRLMISRSTKGRSEKHPSFPLCRTSPDSRACNSILLRC